MYQKSWSYALLFLRCGMWQMELLLLIWGYFLPFYPPNSLKNENFKKMKKNPGDVIILHRCTKDHDHMPYCLWDMVDDGCSCYFSSWLFLALLPPQQPEKWKFLKNEKKCLEISSFYTCVPTIMTRWCTIPEIWCETDRQTKTDRKGDIKRWVLHLKKEDLLTKNIFEKGLISKHI